MTDNSKKAGWLILTVFVVFLVGFNLLAIEQSSPHTRDLLTGVYILGIGTSFFLSYYFENESMLFRGLIWFCENFSMPPGRKMAFFYAGLGGTLGTIAILSGLGVIRVSGHG